MQRIAESFASTMPDWIRTSFFDPEMEKQRLSTHMYQQSDDVRTLRSLDNLHLIDFIELTLKGNDGFETVMNNLLKSNLADYMKKYLVLLPRDWPAQLCAELFTGNLQILKIHCYLSYPY